MEHMLGYYARVFDREKKKKNSITALKESLQHENKLKNQPTNQQKNLLVKIW